LKKLAQNKKCLETGKTKQIIDLLMLS